ncbi:MAG: Ig-like domain-containing protein [bacterium]|nr:Ig-like domain-containing protein [bacterium]
MGSALLLCLVLLTACAVMERPPGGPLDRTPPHVVAVSPDSGSTGLGPIDRLTITFSEKMDRRSATGWLFFFPDQRIRSTKWKGAISAEVLLEEPLPADSVVVVEIAAGLKDAHNVAMKTSRRFPFATGDSLSAGSINGILVMGDTAVTKGVVELYDVPPDTLEYFQQPILRRAATDEQGTFVFDWLPVPGGPWIIRAFLDPDGDRRPGDRSPKRVLRDTLSLSVEHPVLSAGVTTLYPVDTPGRLHAPPFAHFGAVRPVMAWSMAIDDADTGWVPQTVDPAEHPIGFVRPDSLTMLHDIRPGLNRVGFFVDADGDSAYGPVPDSLLTASRAAFAWVQPDSAADTTGWYLEPLLLVESPFLEPGLDADLVMPDTVAVIVPWPQPTPDLPDSTAGDSLAIVDPDTTAVESTESETPREE